MRLRELFVELGIKFDKEKAEQYDAAVGNLKEGLVDLATAAAGVGVALGVTSAFLGKTAVATAEYAEEVTRSAAALGASVRDYQEFRFAFRQLGASTDDLMDAFSTITDRAVDAVEGSKAYAKEFTRIGIAVSSLKGKKPVELFDMYVEAAAKAKDQTQAITSAVRLFGDDLGRRILPALLSTSESFDRFRQLARQTGAVLDEDMIATSRDAQLSWRLLKSAVVSVYRELGAELAPILKDVTRLFADLILNNRELITLGIEVFVREVGEQIEKTKMATKDLIDAFGGGPQGLINMFRVATAAGGALLAVLTGLASAKIYAGISALGTALFPMLLAGGKILLIGAALLGALLVLEDLYVASKGGESIFGDLLDTEALEDIRPVLEGVLETVTFLIEVIETAGKDILKTWKELDDEFGLNEKMLQGAVLLVYGLAVGLVTVVALAASMAAIIFRATADLTRFLVFAGEELGKFFVTLWEYIQLLGDALGFVFEWLARLQLEIVGRFVEHSIEAYHKIAEAFKRSMLDGLREISKHPLMSVLNPIAAIPGAAMAYDDLRGAQAAAGSATINGATANTNADVKIENVNIQATDPEGTSRELGTSLAGSIRFAADAFGSGEV